MAWFPNEQWCAKAGGIIDQEFFDFDAQSDRLVGHDQDYLQLSDGRFHGRFVSCFLGAHASLHIEYANQALSQSIGGASVCYSLGVVLGASEPFRANGVEIDTGAIFVVPPQSAFHLFSPKHASILACVVDKAALDARLACAPQILEWLDALGTDLACLRAPLLAERLRQDAYSALHASGPDAGVDPQPEWIGRALIDSFSAGLMLEWGSGISMIGQEVHPRFARFMTARTTLDHAIQSETPIHMVSDGIEMSKRSLQYAFSRELSVGVSSYALRARLHAVRRTLADPMGNPGSIGDLAAQQGFWSWSHFSKQYRQLFGERPSETKARATA